MKFYSRRNCVSLSDGRVRKHFASVKDWQRELEMYRRIPEFAPRLLHAIPGVLMLEYCPCPHMLDVLEDQERCGFDPAPWRSLRRWIEEVQKKTGCIPADGNLRNYLWDAESDRIIGLDFEHFLSGRTADALLRISAFVMEYDPADTPVKRSAAEILMRDTGAGEEKLRSERESLKRRRKIRRADSLDGDFSMILLAGGRSKRMGRDKAELPFLGSTLLEFQMEKAQMLGIGDLMISGDRPLVPGAKMIPDVLSDRGPLGGLYSCLCSAARERCIVLSVDAPLIPPELLRRMADSHCSGQWQATVAVHDGCTEPLIGIYDRDTVKAIEPLIRDGGAPVRSLLERLNVNYCSVEIREDIWKNCNTPQDYSALVSK